MTTYTEAELRLAREIVANTQKAQGADDLLRQASIFSEALRKIPDEVFRDIAESRDVGHCRSRIAAVLASLSQPQKAQGSGAGALIERMRDVYGALTPGAIERADLDGMAFAVQDAISFLSQPPEASEVEAVAWEWRVIGTKDWIMQRAYPNRSGERTDIEKRPLYAAPPAHEWQPIETAPKGPIILVAYDHDADPYYHPDKDGRLTDYAAIAEGGDFLTGKGLTIAVWSDGYHDNDGYESGCDYWVPGA